MIARKYPLHIRTHFTSPLNPCDIIRYYYYRGRLPILLLCSQSRKKRGCGRCTKLSAFICIFIQAEDNGLAQSHEIHKSECILQCNLQSFDRNTPKPLLSLSMRSYLYRKYVQIVKYLPLPIEICLMRTLAVCTSNKVGHAPNQSRSFGRNSVVKIGR